MKFPKPVPSKTQKRKKKAEKGQWVSWVRERVFERDNHRCRVCHKRAEEMHEIVFRSLGGLVSLNNSIAVCRACHVHLQRHVLDVVGDNANEEMQFVLHVDKKSGW